MKKHDSFGQSESAPEPATGAHTPSREEIAQQLLRIFDSPHFHNSKRSTDLLSFIVQHTLDGDHDSLKERIIGIEVFGRPADYDTALDSIVRVTTTDLRKRLIRYYETPEHQTELRIELPPRAYIATFAPAPAPADPSPAENLPPTPTPRRARLLLAALLFVVLAGLGLLAYRHYYGNPQAALDRFWQPILQARGKSQVLISIAAPGARMNAIAAKSQPDSGTPSLSRFISQQTDYPLADLSAANALASYLNHHGCDSAIRLSGSITLAEMHSSPVILLGTTANEWTTRLSAGLRFRFEQQPDDRLRWIQDAQTPDKHPWSVDIAAPYDQINSEYVLVNRSYDQDTGQWSISVGGLTVLGTIAAQKQLVDLAAMTSLVSQFPANWEQKNLQIVLEIKMYKGSPGASRVLATYTW